MLFKRKEKTPNPVPEPESGQNVLDKIGKFEMGISPKSSIDELKNRAMSQEPIFFTIDEKQKTIVLSEEWPKNPASITGSCALRPVAKHGTTRYYQLVMTGGLDSDENEVRLDPKTLNAFAEKLSGLFGLSITRTKILGEPPQQKIKHRAGQNHSTEARA
ncbi:MAG: hypothetical protein M1127_01310 [Patescibacteria group bacterium]|nr:hypothetical protein [Patescibacteria group bacterium]